MVLKYVREKLGKGVTLPWESIDPSDGQSATNWDGESSQDWFVDSPPGDWEMEPPPAAQPGAQRGEARANEARANGGPSNDAPAAEEPPPSAETPEVEIEEETPPPPTGGSDGGGWTLAMLCLGLSLIGGCVIIPQADANRRLVYQREKLRQDLAQVQKQTAVNAEFLSEIERDPQLTERLAQREMHSVLQGQETLDISGAGAQTGAQTWAGRMSPFSIVNVPPPPPLVPYKPAGGEFSKWCRDPKASEYVLGTGMMLVAAGLALEGKGKGT